MARNERKPSSERREAESLEAREYRDAEGNIHYHTRSYMRDHENDAAEKKERRDAGEE